MTPALSLSGNPNFSLLLPNPGNRSQCLKSKRDIGSFVISKEEERFSSKSYLYTSI